MNKESGSRAKILALLRERDSTVHELATQLGLTKPGVRAHLLKLEQEGLVQRGGSQSGSRKPHVLYTLTEDAEQAFPNAYPLLLRQLLRVLLDRLNPRAVVRLPAAGRAGTCARKRRRKPMAKARRSGDGSLLRC